MPDNKENMPSDHDILTTLVANVGFLKESQDRFHQEMRKSLDDLQNNYTGKINQNSQDIERLFLERVAKKDFECTVAKVSSLENWKNYVLGITIVVSSLSVFLAIELYRHLTLK
jgi:phage host-nuclease inhibitor protein Gam